MDNKKRNIIIKISLAVLSGILAFLAFPPYEFAFLGWICLVPVLFIFRFKAGNKEAFFYFFLSGIIFFGCLLYWLVNVTVPGMIILVIMLSIIYGIFGIIAGCVSKYSMDFLILPFAWVILEYIRSHLFTGFPWGLLGYSQYKNLNLIQIADFTGVYGVSFLLAMFNTAVFASFYHSKKRVTHIVVALLFIIMAVTYSICKFSNYYVWGNLRTSVIQGNIPQEYKWDAAFADDIVKKYIDLSEKAAGDNPELIIWPETAYPYLVDDTTGTPEEINNFIKEYGIPLLTGIIYRKEDKYFNSAALFDKEAEAAGIYNKIHLVPFGEYIPFEKTFSFLRNYIDKPIGDFARGDKYSLFSVKSVVSNSAEAIKTRRTNFYKFGVLICFEDIFPYITRNFVRRGADFVVNITNDAWFGETAAARQHLQASVFRAVENRVPVIRAANTGISCFVDSTGEVLKTVNIRGKEVFVGGFSTSNISIHMGRSYYTVYGDIFVYFCAFVFVLLLIIEGLLKKKEKSSGDSGV